MKSFRLGEPFEIWGQWWLPEKREEILAGRLRCYRGNLELMLLGNFSDLDVNARNLVVDVIHGVGDAKSFTLWRAVQEQPSLSLPGGLRQSFHRMRILVGGHFPKESESRFSAVAFDAPQIGPWMANEPIKQTVQDDKTFSTHFEMNADRCLDFGPCANGVTYRFGSNVATRREAFLAYGFDTTPTAHIDFPEPVDSSVAVDRVERTTDLLTLLVGQDVEHRAIRLYTLQERGGFELLYEFRPPVEEKLVGVREVLAPLPKLAGSFVSILDRWDEERSRMGDSVGLLSDVLDRASPASHVQLLLLAQALEAFHRNVMGGEYLSVEEYEPIRIALVAAIPATVQPDHKEALKAKLKYGNELSLRVRLRKLLEPFTKDLLSRINVDPRIFVSDVVDARNDYTHWVQEREIARPQGAHLANLLSSLRGVTQIILLRHLGVSEDLVVDRMLESPWVHLRRYQPIGKHEEAKPPTP